MPDTVAGLFRTRSEAQEALRKLKQAGFGDSQVSVAAPHARRPGRYGAKVIVGILLGVVLGLIVGTIASGILPGTHPLLPGSSATSTFLLAGVAVGLAGGVAGFLLGMAATGGDELYYEQEVESGRTLVSVAGPRLEEARELMLAAGAIEAAPIDAPLEDKRGRPRPESG
jgi:hypothetical protein